jgi:hypothetical protein
VLLALCCAGCGGGGGERLGKDEYTERIQTLAYGPDARTASALFIGLVVAPHAGCAAEARRFAETLHEIVADVEALEPPAEVESLHERFLSAAKESVDQVDEAVAEVEAGTLTCGQPLNRRIYGLPSTERAQAVITELVEKGYLYVGR